MNLSAFEDQIESAIRNGRRAEARVLLKNLKGQKMARARAKTFANLARRCGMLPLALQILQPIVRPKVAQAEKPAPEEIAAYALVLIGLGAVAEGEKLLKESDPENPEVILAQAFAATKSWDYEIAATRLQQYEKCIGPTDYQRMTASVNLLAAQIALGQYKTAHQKLGFILGATKKQSWSLLHKNALELAAQLAILQSNWEAFDEIAKSGQPKKESEFNLDDFFILKWNAIAELNRSQGSRASLALLEKVRGQAVDNRHYETVRDCDYHRAVVTKDTELALHVYFGTPYESFKRRITQATSDWLILPDSYLWTLTKSRTLKKPRVFDLDEGCESGRGISTAKGRSLHSALKVLSSDFYRPFQMGSLLSAMYPNEHINPSSSPKRAAYLMHRLRRWFEDNEMPLEILNEGGGYLLKSNAPYSIKISNLPANHIAYGKDEARTAMFNKLRSEISGPSFSIHDITKRLVISERSARYFINWAVELNLVEKIGTGRITLYSFGKDAPKRTI